MEGNRCAEAPTRPAIAEIAKGATDEHVRERALSEKRVLITEDRDFGELVYAAGPLQA